MASQILKARCRDCRYTSKGFTLSLLNRADQHADKYGHALDVWEVTPVYHHMQVIQSIRPRPES